MARYDGLLLCSVPPSELETVQARFPGADAATVPLDANMAKRHPDTRILAVMIHDRVTPEVLATLPGLEAVVTRSDGHDHLPAPWMVRQGVAGYHLAGYATQSVAQLSITLMHALLRRVPEGLAVTRAGAWDRTGLLGRSWQDISVGVLGTGRIGGAVVHLLAALGAPRIIGHDIDPAAAPAGVPGFRHEPRLRPFLAACDVLSVHVPLTAETQHLVDAAALAAMPPGSLLVNTARGDVVDQAAVEASLREGHLAGYGADVLPGEPHSPDLQRFQGLPNVLLTPHLGAHERSAVAARYDATARIVDALLDQRAADVADYRIA